MSPLQIRLTGLLVILLLLANYCWLLMDHKPFAWDESIHYLGAVGYYHAWLGHGLAGLAAFFTQSDFYPPLTEWLTGLIFHITGPQPDVAAFLNVFYLTAIMGLLLAMGRRWKSPDTGIMACYLFLTSALVSLQSKLFMLDIPLTFYVLLGIWAFDHSRHFREWRWALIYGLAFGLAMLTKWSALFFLALPPLITVVFMSFKTPEQRGRMWLNLLLAYGITMVIAFPWYALHLIKLIKNTSGYLYDRGALENDPALLTIQAWIYYPLAVLKQLSLPAGLLALAGFGWAMIKRKAVMPAWLWVILPCLILTLIRNKDWRYTMPLLPVFGLISLLWLQQLKQDRRQPLIIILAVVLSLQMVYSHVGAYAGPVHRVLNGFGGKLPVVESQAPDPRRWPLDKILADVKRAGQSGGRVPLLRVIPDAASFTRVTFAVEETRHPHAVQVSSITNWPAFTDFAVTKTGGLGLPFLIQRQTAITEALFNSASAEAGRFHLLQRYELPDGSQARLYQRTAPSAAGLDAPAVIALLHTRLKKLLGDYIRQAGDLTVLIDPYSPQDTLAGHFKTIRVSAGRGLIGDFKHKPLGVPFEKMDVAVENIVLDVQAIQAGRLLPYALERLEVKTLALDEKKVNQMLAASPDALGQCRLVMENQQLKLRYLGRYPLEVSLGLQVKLDPNDQRSENLFGRLLKINTPWGRLPAGLLQLLVNDFNPLFNLSGFPVSVRLGKCVINHHHLLIGTMLPGDGPANGKKKFYHTRSTDTSSIKAKRNANDD